MVVELDDSRGPSEAIVQGYPEEFPDFNPDQENKRHSNDNAPFPGDATLVEYSRVQTGNVDGC